MISDIYPVFGLLPPASNIRMCHRLKNWDMPKLSKDGRPGRECIHLQALLGKQVLRREENLVETALLNNLEAEQERDIYIILQVKNSSATV